MSEINYCSKCGAGLIGDEVYCRHCGSKIDWEPLVFAEQPKPSQPVEPVPIEDTEPEAPIQPSINQVHQKDQVDQVVVIPAGPVPILDTEEEVPIQSSIEQPEEDQQDQVEVIPVEPAPIEDTEAEVIIQPYIKQPQQGIPTQQNNTSKLEQIQESLSKIKLPQHPSLPKLSLSDPKVKYSLIGIVGVIAIAIGILLSGIGVDSGTYAVEFNPNGGSGGPQSIEVNRNERVVKPKDEPTLSGYEFTGWFTDTKGQYRYNFRTPVDKDRTLYAGWEEEKEVEPVVAAADGPKTVGEVDQKKQGTPSYFVTTQSNNGIYVRREPFVPNIIDSNSVMYINQGDTTVHLTNLNQQHLDKHGYTWLKVESPNGQGWVREDIVKGVN